MCGVEELLDLLCAWVVFFGCVEGGDGGFEVLGDHVGGGFLQEGGKGVFIVGEGFLTPDSGLLEVIHLDALALGFCMGMMPGRRTYLVISLAHSLNNLGNKLIGRLFWDGTGLFQLLDIVLQILNETNILAIRE